MAETKDELAARAREQEAEIERLRGQLAAAGATPATAAPARFLISEADRQDLLARGYATIGGRVLLLREVRELLDASQAGVPLDDPAPEILAEAERVVGALRVGRPAEGAGAPHVDFVYPSVARGVIDPAAAGAPGVTGPSA